MNITIGKIIESKNHPVVKAIFDRVMAGLVPAMAAKQIQILGVKIGLGWMATWIVGPIIGLVLGLVGLVFDFSAFAGISKIDNTIDGGKFARAEEERLALPPDATPEQKAAAEQKVRDALDDFMDA